MRSWASWQDVWSAAGSPRSERTIRRATECIQGNLKSQAGQHMHMPAGNSLEPVSRTPLAIRRATCRVPGLSTGPPSSRTPCDATSSPSLISRSSAPPPGSTATRRCPGAGGRGLPPGLLGDPRVRNHDGSWTERGSFVGLPDREPGSEAARCLRGVLLTCKRRRPTRASRASRSSRGGWGGTGLSGQAALESSTRCASSTAAVPSRTSVPSETTTKILRLLLRVSAGNMKKPPRRSE